MSLKDKAIAARDEINALPVTRKSQSDPAIRENVITTIMQHVIYDWAAVDGSLFPDGNPLNLDLKDPAIRASWISVREHQRDIVAAHVDAWDGKSDLTFEQDGLSIDLARREVATIDPPQADPIKAFEIVRSYFPDLYIHNPKRGEHVWEVNTANYPELDYHATQFRNVYAFVALEVKDLMKQELANHVGRRFDIASLQASAWAAGMQALASRDWIHYSRAQVAYHITQWRHVQQAKTEALKPKKAGLTDFLQARLDKARLHLDASTSLEQFKALRMVGARAKTSKTNRTWGIELEIIDAGAIAFDAAGGWQRIRDGSLRSQIGDARTYDPWEFVSPILDQTYSDGLWMICDQAQHTVKYHKAGVHVHVGTTTRKRKQYDPITKRTKVVGGERMTTHQVSRLIELYATVSPLLDPIIARTKTREFCVPTRVDQWAEGWYETPASKKPHRVRPLRERKDDAIQNARFWAQITKGPNHDQEPTNWKRHQELNLQSLNKYGTIEFRSMGAVYDYEYLTRWAWLCRAMVDYAQSDAPMSAVYQLTDFNSLAYLLNRYSGEPLNLGRKAA